MRPLTRLILLGSLLATGCDPGVEPEGEGAMETGASTDSDDAPSPQANPGTVLLLLDVNPEPACNTVGVTQVQMVARRVGCESPPPAPCTVPVNPPPVEGDVFTCPATDPTRILGVEVTQSGRYTVETVATTASAPTRECFGLDGLAEIVVPAADVEAGSTVMLDSAAIPCP